MLRETRGKTQAAYGLTGEAPLIPNAVLNSFTDA